MGVNVRWKLATPFVALTLLVIVAMPANALRVGERAEFTDDEGAGTGCFLRIDTMQMHRYATLRIVEVHGSVECYESVDILSVLAGRDYQDIHSTGNTSFTLRLACNYREQGVWSIPRDRLLLTVEAVQDSGPSATIAARTPWKC
jgi:hypothetical protein